jgi:glycosyltransferase involved in cell wall biosynthesis
MKISLITVCFNSEATIRDTFDSVLAQTYKNIEYIIVDGKSSDSTMDIIKEYKPKFENGGVQLSISSEKDNGLYDAMNKGIKRATGDIIGIINSDDIIHDKDAFKKIVKRFKEDKCDATYSDLYIMDYETMSVPNRIFIAGKKSYKLGWYPPHPTLYVKKEIYDKYGNYDTKYRIAADYDFMVRIMKAGIKLSYIKEPLIYMRAGGTSTSSLKSYKKSFDEAIDVLKKNKIKFVYPVNILRTLVIFKQRFMGMLKIKFKKGQ